MPKNKKFLDRIKEFALRKKEIIDQLTAEENMLWANATDDDIEEFIKKSLKMAKGNEGLRRLNARKRRSMAKKAVAENT